MSTNGGDNVPLDLQDLDPTVREAIELAREQEKILERKSRSWTRQESIHNASCSRQNLQSKQWPKQFRSQMKNPRTEAKAQTEARKKAWNRK
jgi:hypothetical protein